MSKLTSLPWVNLSNWDFEPSGNIIHSLVAFGDDADTPCDSLSCNRMVTGNHDNLS